MEHNQITASLRSPRPMLVFAFTALSLLGMGACKSTSKEPEAPSMSQTPAASSASKAAATPRTGHADIMSEATATATVVMVDKATRNITLRREDGKSITVEAGPEVRNFEQIAAGDTLRVRYQEKLSATLLPAGSSASATEGALAAGRAKAGAKPAGGMGMLASARVKIESIDREKSIVVFSLPGDELSTVRAARPEGREFVKKLEVGDIVQLDYAVALALAIDKL